MNEEKERKIKELKEGLLKRVDDIPEPSRRHVLDGGKHYLSEVFDWFYDECKKIKKEYPDD